MKLDLKSILCDPAAYGKMGILLPGYDPVSAARKAVEAPRWVHFGIGNIFRVFLGGIAHALLEQGELDRGVTCVETYDPEIVDRIYRPFDNLAVRVILNGDGTRETAVLASMAEAVKARVSEEKEWERLKEIFRSPSLQMVSFTITEKGYRLTDAEGTLLPSARMEMEQGPGKAAGAMAVLSAMLYERYLAGGTPIALVSMDNCARNGKLLREAVTRMCRAWRERGFTEGGFAEWVEDEVKVAFDSTMIDKITPRPSERIAQDLERAGLEDMGPIITEKRTYIAPFVNAERPQYLVIEDRFPNGRPPLEKGPGVYMADFDTVCRAERMKVTACLNPAHTAAGPLGVVLGQEYFADMLRDLPCVMRLARTVVYDEGIPVAPDPGILSPRAFADEVFERFSNIALGDTNLRLATDASQGLGVRFGETVRAWAERGRAGELTGIPLGIAGFFRYMMGLDDSGNPFELAPDPMAEEIHGALSTVRLGHPETFRDQLRPYLSNADLFHVDLYRAGIGLKAEGFFREMIAGKGAVRRTLEKTMG